MAGTGFCHQPALEEPGMFIGAADLQEQRTIDTDICIIGCGAAGIAIARSFLGTKTRVAIIEGGGFEYDAESQDIYKGSNSGLPYPPLDVTRLRYFGGSTNHWEGQVRPFSAADFETHEWLPNSGWPIKLPDIEPYYEQAFNICMFGSGTYQWERDYWLRQLGIAHFLPDERIFELEFFQCMRRVQPSWQSFGTYVRDALDKSENISVYLDLNVIELNTSEQGDAVSSVSLVSKSGKHLALRARTFVLATGGIENARLLLVSNTTVKEGIGNRNGLVGRFFCDHPVGHAGRLVTTERTPIDKAFAWHTTASGSCYTAQLSPSFAFRKKHRLANCCVRLLPAPLPHSAGSAAAKHIVEALRRGEWPDNLLSEIGTVITDLDALVERQYHKLRHTRPEYFTVWTRVEPVPNYDSRVALTDERDRFGKPRVALNWKVTDLTQHTMNRLANTFATEVGRLRIGRVQIDPGLENDWENHFHVGNHHMCTTRMAEDERNGVVDADCKVFSMDNLYIAGSSVFSTAGSGTPTLTLVALALRLADHLKGLHV
ncbi:MAG: GMC family oxidoreductase [Thiogranum sp.]|nr:GMC family oxidoreductase [Thiogranum sp.]